MKTKKLILTGLFAALIFLATRLIAFPIPALTGAYVNAGDALIIVAGYILGGPLAAIAAGVGSGLADISYGSMLYAPATLVIKALCGFLAGIMLRKQCSAGRTVLALTVTELVMVAGYFLYEFILYGKAAFLTVLPNVIQGVFGAVVGVLIILAFRKNPVIRNIRK